MHVTIKVELPSLGESVVEGTIGRWLVAVGDRVEVDQPLLEVTTDKVDAEIPSPAAGVIEALLVQEGDTVDVGAELVRIAEGDAAAAAPTRAASSEAPDAPAEDATSTAAPPATPLARRSAEQAGVDVRDVAGSGAHGRVTKGDVDRFAKAPGAEPVEPAAPAPSRVPPRPEPDRRPAFLQYQLQQGDKVIPLSPLRKLVAEHMVISKQTSPHVGTVAEIDMSGVARVRDTQKRAFKDAHGFTLSYLPFIVHATVRALREFPRLNASLVEDAIVEKKDIHIGIAVETEKGLVVPVVRHADRLSLAGLAEAVEDLASRARSKKLSADELKGGSFTISNPGRHGNLYGFAIINQPQVGILRVGEIVKRPVVREIAGDDAIVVRPIMHLALSYDHRVVDGSPANSFLHRVRMLLEDAEFDL
jgi:2-oxoglutarate dehydrogenase E2 component (dihydrolipoamide succinyltransferase)